jgi:heterotetrameric sarcosine oxidase gamma subunit
MIERRHALADYDGPRSMPADGALCLAERLVEGAWLSVAFAGDQAPPDGMSALLGLARTDPAVGWAHSSASALVATTAPGRVLTLTQSSAEASTLGAKLDVERVIECRAQRAWLRFTGTDARAFLDRQLGIDLHRDAFGPGRFALTRLGLIDIAVHADQNDAFDLLVARSFTVALARQIALRAQAEGRSITIDPQAD